MISSMTLSRLSLGRSSQSFFLRHHQRPVSISSAMHDMSKSILFLHYSPLVSSKQSQPSLLKSHQYRSLKFQTPRRRRTNVTDVNATLSSSSSSSSTSLSDDDGIRLQSHYTSAAPATTSSSPSSSTPTPSSPTRPRSETRCRQKAKRKVALIVAYEGSKYHGFQRNKGVQTISDELEHALFEASSISSDNVGSLEKIKWQVAARTDRGVSAAGNLVSAKLLFDKSELEIGQAFTRTKSRINRFLPDHIRILSISQITGSFNARSCCESRWYEYLLPLSVFFIDDTHNNNDIHNVLNKFNQILKQFEGSHLFHNFTIGLDHTLPPRVQSRRFITECTCELEPTIVQHPETQTQTKAQAQASDINTQMIRVRVRGQSFMLHQIRKMISLSIMIMQDRVPENAIELAFHPKVLINIAPAPAAGLYLDCCHFGWYNEKQKPFLSQPLNMDDVNPLRQDFIHSHIIPSIAHRFENESSLQDYFNTIDTHPTQFD